jgi:uncharacterized protein (TIRG00374 family)
MIAKLKKNILIFISLAAILYLILSLYADYNSIKQAFKKFNWAYFPLLIILAFLNYQFRFIKWHYYIKLLNIELKIMDSYKIFMSGLVMSVTPGKFGEVIKAYLVKNKTNVNVAKTAPIIFVERLTDLISVILLALIGAFYFNFAKTFVLITLFLFLIIVYLVSNKTITLRILGLLENIKFLNKYLHKINEAYESSYNMLQLRELLYMIFVSIVAWGFECIAYYLILINFNISFGIIETILFAMFVYTLSTIIGSISMLPGGLGLTEIAFTFLMQSKGIPKDLSVASTMIIRVVTLWFAVIVGILFTLNYQKELKNIEDI